MPEAISEKIVEKLPIPDAGNKVHFFSGSTLQGKKAPAGFGVRVTAGGTKSFVLFHRVDGPEVSRNPRPLGRERPGRHAHGARRDREGGQARQGPPGTAAGRIPGRSGPGA